MDELPPDPAVSVILCTYSPEMYEHFREAAESVLTQSYSDVELVVIIDGHQELCKEVQSDFGERSQVTLFCNQQNRGLLHSRNVGAEKASGDVVAFIDDDAVADERWIANLVSTYKTTDAIAVGGRMVAEWVSNKPDFLPEEFYWLVGVTHKGFPDNPGEVRNTFGSNLSFRREEFLTLGGFTIDIGGRKEGKNLQAGETELCVRMQTEYGEGVMYNPNAVVAHKVFPYRTRPLWLLDRAFWQGYSKRVMEVLVNQGGNDESEFLSRLLREFIPDRLKRLILRPNATGAQQLLAVFVLLAAVGAGYLYGWFEWR